MFGWTYLGRVYHRVYLPGRRGWIADCGEWVDDVGPDEPRLLLPCRSCAQPAFKAREVTDCRPDIKKLEAAKPERPIAQLRAAVTKAGVASFEAVEVAASRFGVAAGDEYVPTSLEAAHRRHRAALTATPEPRPAIPASRVPVASSLSDAEVDAYWEDHPELSRREAAAALVRERKAS